MRLTKLFFTIALVALSITLNAQFAPKAKGKASFNWFSNTDTYVVLSDDDGFNAAIRAGMKKYWQHTDFYFIKADELPKYITDQSLSFITLTDLQIQGKKQEVRALALLNGGYTDTKFYLNNTLGYISVDSRGNEKKSNDITYRVGHMVKQLSDMVTIIQEKDLKAVDYMKMRELLKSAYNEKAGQLKDKTLLIDQTYAASKIVSMDEFKKKYKYDVKIVPKTEIEKAIRANDPTKAYLVSAWNLYKINTVTSCKNGEIIYAEFEQEDKISFSSTSTFDYNDVVLLNATVKKSK